MWYVYTHTHTHTHTHKTEYYSALQQVLGGYYAKWNKSEKDKYCMRWPIEVEYNKLVNITKN